MDKDGKKGIDPKFVAFLRATLSKMAGTGIIDPDFINVEFWSSWPRKFYNIRTYDSTKEEFEKGDVPEGELSVDDTDEEEQPLRKAKKVII